MKKSKIYAEVKNPIYGNWRILHPDGYLMFYGDDKKADWYLKKNLAVLVSEREIRLTFMPKGNGSAIDLYGCSPKQNKCVVCGGERALSRHHVLPYCYRRHLPEEYKSRNAHDVVPLCGNCHKKYEYLAMQLKKQIALEYGESDLIVGLPEDVIEKRFIHGFINCLLNRKQNIPLQRIVYMEEQIKKYFNLDELIDLNLLLKRVEKPKKNDLKKQPSKFRILVSKISDIQAFVERWRNHFIENMHPRHLPLGWDVRATAKRLETKYD